MSGKKRRPPVQPTRSQPWQAMGQSVPGAAHLRAGRPNQDAIALQPARPGQPLNAAVADGHGSARSFRSGAGARIAVKRAVTVIQRLLAGDLAQTPSLSTLNHLTEEQLPKLLHRQWQQAVDRYLAFAPVTDEELAQAGVARAEFERNPRLACGTTLLAVAVTQTFILYLQLGDGDMVTVSDQGQASHPLAKDARLFANETTSLAAPNAWQEMRVSLQVLAAPFSTPALIMLTTDGYANSFASDDAFMRAGPDFLTLLRAEGPLPVQEKLSDWLAETSQAGSGDDITLALLYHSRSLTSAVSPYKKNTCQPQRRRKPGPPWRRQPGKKG